MWDGVPAGGAVRLRPVLRPLEVAYDHSQLDAEETKRRIQAGTDGIWRYADFLPFESRPASALASRV